MDCGEVLLADAAFMRNLYRKATEQRFPINGSIEITHRCNLRCKHCYLGSQKNIHENACHCELDTATLLKIIDDITDAGCLQLLITGGDPLIRNDFIDIYQHAVKNGLLIKIFTNGTLITGAIMDVLQTLPPQEIEITLYGATATTYENVTNVPGSFKKCMLGIERLVAAKIPLKLKTIVLSLNQDEFFAMERFATNLGLKFRYDCMVQPCLNGDQFPLQFRITPEEVIAIDFANKERRAQWLERSEQYNNVLTTDKLYNCGAGRRGFHIDPYGNLMPCMTAIAYKYNLLQGSFVDGWNNFLPREFLAKLAPPDFVCTKCADYFLCSFCPAFFYLENKSEVERSEYLCQIGKLRRSAIKNIKNE